ncbi:hypothetical protein AB0J83_21785 [Actinoplanes sp. NPDC049596]|uniref:hypothetical protein n=1 Tax=unclassified Actinoplanes TaxID=2626549 RepID=UPI00342FC094
MTGTYALVVAIEKYGKRSGLASLPGTLERAYEFCDWLVQVRGTDPENIFFCGGEPPLAGPHTFPGTRAGIRTATKKLVAAGRDTGGDVFVHCSGHGYQVALSEQRQIYSDVLVGANYDQDGERCLRLDELRNELQFSMGPASHFWFVDTCRNRLAVQVPELALGLANSDRGAAVPYTMFSAAEGMPAFNDTQFGDALLGELHGRGRAKIRVGGAYWVTFARLSETLGTLFHGRGREITAQPGPGEGRIARIVDVRRTPVTVTVDGLQPGETLRLLLTGGERQPRRITIVEAVTHLEVDPGDYFVQLERGDQLARRVDPAGTEKLDLYEARQLRFDARSTEPEPADIFDSLPSADPGYLGLSYFGDLATPYRMAPRGGLVMDPRADLETFLSVQGAVEVPGSRGHTAGVADIRVLSDLPRGQARLLGRPSAAELVSRRDGIARAGLTAESGPHRLHLDGGEQFAVATAALPGRVTLVVAPASAALPVFQYSLAGRPGALTVHFLEKVGFSAWVQRRFGQNREVISEHMPPRLQGLWRQLLSGDWPDPITVLVAGFELVRRGAHAADPADLRRLVGRLRNEYDEELLPDLGVLSALAHGRRPVRRSDADPLLLDASTAIGIGGPPEGMATDYSGPWTMWRPWLAA